MEAGTKQSTADMHDQVGAYGCFAFRVHPHYLMPIRTRCHEMEHSFAMQEVNPWEVKGDADGKIDYEKLQKKVQTPSAYCLRQTLGTSMNGGGKFTQLSQQRCSLAAHASERS